MAHTKPILAAISSGMGVALLLVAIHIQRDRFAFTSGTPSPEVLTHATFPVTVPPVTKLVATRQATEPEVGVPAVTLEPVIVRPAKPRKLPKMESVERAQPACNPLWRELESGPAGKKVREICAPAPSDDVPRS